MSRILAWVRFIWTGAPPAGYDAADAWALVIAGVCIVGLSGLIVLLLWAVS